MFGFLKDKLKKAIGAFSKSAETEVKEEKVDDSSAIEKAKQEEKKILAKKAAPKQKATAAPPKKEQVKETPKKEAPQQKTPASKATPAQLPKKEIQKDASRRVDAKDSTPAVTTQKEGPKHADLQRKETAPKKEQAKEEKREEEKKHTHSAQHTPKESITPTTKETAKHTPAPQENKKEEKEFLGTGATRSKDSKKPSFFNKLFGKKEEQEETQKPAIKEKIPVAPIPEQHIVTQEPRSDIEDEELEHEEPSSEEENNEPQEERTGFFGKLKEAFTKKTLTDEKFDELFWELEVAMLENNVAVEVIEKIKNDLRDELTSGKVSRLGIEDMITTRLRQSIEELFDVESFDMVERIKNAPKPFKLCIIGVNGAGKTTTLAKIIHLLQKNNLTCVVAASDTFRAAAIDQLKEHTERLGVKLISQGYNADPAAVAFDAIKHAEAKGIDVVLIDTAGRLHSNTNLMAELEKVIRVSKPDMKLFVGEAITGNDCVEQAQVFNKLVGIDAIILSKADIDEKGGAAISVSYVTGKPILYLGMGQTYDDLVPFDKEKIIESLELE